MTDAPSPLLENSGLTPDTIVAQATPAGVSALAVVRLSGGECDRILSALAPDTDLPEERRATLMALHGPDGQLIDRAVVTRFVGPGSYTGQDALEITCHGGWVVAPRLVDACCAAGARLAEPGEFTKRAVLLGKMDLLQAEGVADLIEGRSPRLQRIAAFQVEKSLSRRVSALRQAIVRLHALLVHHIDFPEEDDAPVPLDEVVAQADGVRRDMEALAATAPEGELLREGALVVLAGRPNSGKSSLFNALIGTERAIVTELPGTTRDALETVVQLGGFPFRVVDTAGMRQDAELVERMGIEVAERMLRAADVVLYCVDGTVGLLDEETEFLEGLGDQPVVVVTTKCDLENHAGVDTPFGVGIPVSAVSGHGLPELRERLPRLVFEGLVEMSADSPVLTRERHRRAIGTALAAVNEFVTAVRAGVPAEMASTHLRPAETALEELLGVISTDDVLDRVFSDFCVGK